MKTYIDFSETYIKFEDFFIPKSNSNRFYLQFLEEQAEGIAELVPYTPPPLTWEDIRIQRDVLLAQSDWAVLSDVAPSPNKEAWLNYRQVLRDLPQNFPTPEAVVWPTKPS